MRQIFPSLIGNTKTKERLAPLIKSGRLPHAFLIDGAPGSGRYTLALELAAAINCLNRDNEGTSLPCGVCDMCKKIKGTGSLDVKVLKKADDKATIGVNEVKELRSDMYLSSTEAEYTVYIIRDAEKMTPEAQNALLIVLEEPPAKVKIILISNGLDKILTTIRSRAQYIPTSRFTTEELIRYVKKPEGMTEERFLALARCSDGRVGRLKELSSPEIAEEIEEKRRTVSSLVDAFADGMKYSHIMRAFSLLPEKRGELTEILEEAINALRDMLVARQTDSFTPLFFLNVTEAKEKAKSISPKRLLKIQELLKEAILSCTKNANVQALITDTSVKIKRI